MRVLHQTVCLSRHKPSGIPLLLEIEQCSAAEEEIDFLGAEVLGVGFTRDGLEPFIQSARTQFRLGTVQFACKEGVRILQSLLKVEVRTA